MHDSDQTKHSATAEPEQALKALLESETRYRKLLEAAPDGIFVNRCDRIVYINPMGLQLLGAARADQVLGRSPLDIIHPDSHELVRQRISALLEGQKYAPPIPEKFLRLDGSWLDVEVSATPITDEGEPAILVFFRDVSERKRAEDALRMSEERFRLLVEQAADGIFVSDAEGHYLDVNSAGCAMLGYSRDEILRMAIADVIAPEEVSRLPPEETRVGSGKVVRSEWRFRRKDGSFFHGEILSRQLPDGRLQAILRDITERRQAEAALRASEAQLRLITNNLPVLIAYIDAGQRYRFNNRGYEEWFGHSSAELKGRHLEEVLGPAAYQAIAPRIERVLSGEFIRFEDIIDYKSAGRRIVEAAYVPDKAEDGLVRGFVALIIDVTERKRAEQELVERRAEMEQLLQLHVASQTAAAIAHELNQPLNAIASYNEAALRMLQAGNPKPDKLAHALEASVQQTQRVGRSLRHLLEFLHKGETVTEAVDLNQSVCEALDVLEADGYDGFQRVLELAPDLPRVQANAIQVQRVLINLLRNGVEAMRVAGVPTGPITVSVRTAANGNMAHVTVRDSGPGLDPETARRIFEPFFTTKPTGIGMGLAISRALIEAHGGRLWAELDDGPGGTFHFTLPFAS